MSIEQSNVVDAIGTGNASGAVHLSISDHLPWDDQHLVKLQAKLNTYLAFLESGEIYAIYPSAAGKEFVIEVIFKYRPSEHASTFLQSASMVISEAGFALTYGPLNGGYVDDHA